MSTLAIFLALTACSNSTGPDAVADLPPDPPAIPDPPADPNAIVVETSAGPMVITPVYHGTAYVQMGGRTLWIDPWSKGVLVDRPKADVVLITDVHFDHLDADAIAAVVGPSAVLVGSSAVAAALTARPIDHVVANGGEVVLGDLTVTATPMYNLTRGPEEGGLFHDPGRGNGYILRYGGKAVYFAGDTECTPEMRALTGIDVAFLPMNLPYTMTPEEAADCVRSFRPAVAIPYHYAGSDLSAFQGALAGLDGVTPRIVEFYPGGLPW